MSNIPRGRLGNGNVTRNVRIDNELDSNIQAIASAEDRSISNTIQRLLREAVKRYCELHPELSV